MSVFVVTADSRLRGYWQAVLPETVQWLSAMPDPILHPGAVVVVDSAMPGLPALDDAQWSAWGRYFRMVLAESAPSLTRSQLWVRQGGRGYCHAYLDDASWRNILSVVTAGGLWLGEALLGQLLQSAAATSAPSADWRARVSEREAEVALWVSHGASNKDIARELDISERTVKAHLSSLFEKLQVEDRLQLALKVLGRSQNPF